MALLYRSRSTTRLRVNTVAKQRSSHVLDDFAGHFHDLNEEVYNQKVKRFLILGRVGYTNYGALNWMKSYGSHLAERRSCH